MKRALPRTTALILSSAVALAVIACAPLPQKAPVQPAPAAKIAIEDLRDPKWREMQVVDTGAGVVQYTGDAALLGGVVAHLQQRLSALPAMTPETKVTLKTADVRLSLPSARLSVVGVMSNSANVAAVGTLISLPISALLSSVSKNKSASAVFCVTVDGQDYFASDARLFRMDAEGELRDSIETALQLLLTRIERKSPATSVACEPGWEGGQPRRGQ